MWRPTILALSGTSLSRRRLLEVSTAMASSGLAVLGTQRLRGRSDSAFAQDTTPAVTTSVNDESLSYSL